MFRKGIPPWNKGLKATATAIKNQSNAHLGLKHTEEQKKKISESLLRTVQKDKENGIKRIFSEEVRRKMSNSHKGKKGKNLSEETKKKLSLSNYGDKNPFYGKHHSEEVRRKMSNSHKGKKRPPRTQKHKDNLSKSLMGHKASEETKLKLSLSHKGIILSKETRQKMSNSRRGEKGSGWKGGITPLSFSIRNSTKYKDWRHQVFEKDNFTCQKCMSKGIYLHAHHKYPFGKIIEEIKTQFPLSELYDQAMSYAPLWDVHNGISLCKKCHHHETWGDKSEK